MVEALHIAIFAGIALFGVVAVPPLLHNVDTGANIIDQLFDVNATNSTENDILIFQNGTWITGNVTQFLENQTKSHVNVGGGAEVFKNENSTTIQLRTLIGTGAINIQQNENDITISTGGGPNGTVGIANIQTPNGLFEAQIDEDTVEFIGNGIAISNGSSILFDINATVNELIDVNVTDVSDGDVLVLVFNQTSGLWENELFSDLTSVHDVFFPAQDASVDDLTGADCVNSIVYDYFDGPDGDEFRRDVVEFCADSDPDDNITWFYVMPKDYITERNFKFRLLWSDDNADVGAVMALATDDCEESVGPLGPKGDVTCSSSDLELHCENCTEPDDNDIVGMRFTGLAIPQGATILDARIQFHVDETNPNDPIIVVFRGEDIDDSPALTSADFDLSSRTNTTASVQWNVPDWENVHDEGAAQLSADLSPIIQEIVDRVGWVSGNDITIMINEWVGCTPTSCPTNFGNRHAESQEGEDGNQPELTVSFDTGGGGADSPVCFEFSLIPVANTETIDGSFIARDTVCVNRSGLDQLSTTEFIVNATDHNLAAEDMVFLRIHRPNDFVVNDFESDVYVLGGSLEWLN